MVHRHPAESYRAPTIELLARAIERHANTRGDHTTALATLSLHRRDAPTEPVECIYDFGLAVTVQGAKQVLVGDSVLSCDPGESMLTPIDAPIISHVTRATRREPYLALLLRLDTRSIASALSEMSLPRSATSADVASISIERLDPMLLDALNRLIEALESPRLLPHLAPLIQQEIIFRLLLGPHATHLQTLLTVETPGQQIARLVAWMKQNFAESIRVSELATKANMSPSTFGQRFRAATGMTPLQFLKQLRLEETRQLMLNQHRSASEAASAVGYRSVSQFSREYSRQFGASPQEDVRRMRSLRQ